MCLLSIMIKTKDSLPVHIGLKWASYSCWSLSTSSIVMVSFALQRVKIEKGLVRLLFFTRMRNSSTRLVPKKSFGSTQATVSALINNAKSFVGIFLFLLKVKKNKWNRCVTTGHRKKQKQIKGLKKWKNRWILSIIFLSMATLRDSEKLL